MSHEYVNTSTIHGTDEDDIIDCQSYCTEDDIQNDDAFVTMSNLTWNKIWKNDTACSTVDEVEDEDQCCELLRNNIYRLIYQAIVSTCPPNKQILQS